MKNKTIMIFNFIAGICFFLVALLGGNYVFIPLGCCFVVLGIVNGRDNNDKGNK